MKKRGKVNRQHPCIFASLYVALLDRAVKGKQKVERAPSCRASLHSNRKKVTDATSWIMSSEVTSPTSGPHFGHDHDFDWAGFWYHAVNHATESNQIHGA